jgi:hypothetical protein
MDGCPHRNLRSLVPIAKQTDRKVKRMPALEHIVELIRTCAPLVPAIHGVLEVIWNTFNP